MKNYTLLVCALFTSSIALAQNPCGTVVEIFNPPGPQCSSLFNILNLESSPPGGTYSGAIVSSNGTVSTYGTAAGSYMVYYTAPDSCATVDSIEIEVVATNSTYELFNPFDCATNSPTELELFATVGESITYNQNNETGGTGFTSRGGYEVFPINSGAPIDIEIITSNNYCMGVIEVPTINVPSVTADVNYDCGLNTAFLEYTGPAVSRSIQWRRYGPQFSYLESIVYIGTPIPVYEDGNYQARVIFDNGCENTTITNVPGPIIVKPSASAGSDTNLGCLATPTDIVTLVGHSDRFNVTNYLWSTVDGSPFPGDSTIQITRVPGVPAQYILRAQNVNSRCISDPDIAIVSQDSGDVVETFATICEDEIFNFDGQALSVAGTYQSVLTGSQGCDSVNILILTVNELPDVVFSANGPDANGNFDVVATATNGTAPYMYAWCNGATGNTVMGIPLDCEVAITDANGCTNIVNVNTQVSATVQLIPGKFELAPNPVYDYLNWTYGGSATLITTEVHTSTGQLIAKTPVTDTQNARIDLAHVPAGLYTITWLDTDGRMVTRRVVKQ